MPRHFAFVLLVCLGCRSGPCLQDLAEFCGAECPTLDETLAFVRDRPADIGDVTINACGGVISVVYYVDSHDFHMEYYDQSTGELVGVTVSGGDPSECPRFGRPPSACLLGCTVEVICASPYCDETIDPAEQCETDPTAGAR